MHQGITRDVVTRNAFLQHLRVIAQRLLLDARRQVELLGHCFDALEHGERGREVEAIPGERVVDRTGAEAVRDEGESLAPWLVEAGRKRAVGAHEEAEVLFEDGSRCRLEATTVSRSFDEESSRERADVLGAPDCQSLSSKSLRLP